jgi:bleomycin hydrolase
MDEFKQAIIRQRQDGKVVWFGSDVGKFGEREKGIWDDRCFDAETFTGLDLKLSKAESLDYWFSAMNHAMVITGVNLDDGKPNRWKIENSWGDKGGEKGYYICSDSWFDEYVYQAAVEAEYLGELAELAKQEPITLQPWDPMGTLAD